MGFLSAWWEVKSVRVAALASVGILLTHLVFGARFIRGPLTRELRAWAL